MRRFMTVLLAALTALSLTSGAEPVVEVALVRGPLC